MAANGSGPTCCFAELPRAEGRIIVVPVQLLSGHGEDIHVMTSHGDKRKNEAEQGSEKDRC